MIYTKRTKKEKLALVAAWKESGMSVRAFERLHGISSGRLCLWASGRAIGTPGRPEGWRGTHRKHESAPTRRTYYKPVATDTDKAARLAAIRAAQSARQRRALGLHDADTT